MSWRGETEKGPSLQLYQSDFGRFRSPVHCFPREQSPRQVVVAPFTSSPSQGSILTLSTRWKTVPPFTQLLHGEASPCLPGPTHVESAVGASVSLWLHIILLWDWDHVLVIFALFIPLGQQVS